MFTSALRQNRRTCDLAQDWGRRGKERGTQILIDNRFYFVTLNSPPAVFQSVFHGSLVPQDAWPPKDCV